MCNTLGKIHDNIIGKATKKIQIYRVHWGKYGRNILHERMPSAGLAIAECFGAKLIM